MKSVAGHIISNLNWSTTFDEKEKASYLQDRLSSLSRMKLQREIAKVFDDSCPQDQTWKIDSLELDLGVIDFNYMETELIQKIRDRLAEKLNDLVTYSGIGNEKLEIFETSQSQINLVQEFLTTGVFSWNFRQREKSINSLLLELLRESTHELVEMIRKVGKTDVNVRRRMAWQISEPSVIQIIHGLEPNESEHIIDFSNELIALQSKEAIVKTSNADLKKNIWFWVFNYLLTERGTLFNKVAFVKSSIKQMASHYNISYSDLLTLINRAVIVVAERYHVHSAFVSTIKELVDEVRPNLKGAQESSETPVFSYRDLLNDFFMRKAFSFNRREKGQFNDLIMSYSKKNKTEFRNFIQNLDDSEINWIDVVKVLEDRTLEVVLKGMSTLNSRVVLHGISYLNVLSKDCELDMRRDSVWYLGIKLMLENRNTTLSEQMMVDYLIENLFREDILKKEINPFILSVVTPGLEIPTVITGVFSRTLQGLAIAKSDSYYYEYLTELLQEFSNLLIEKSINKNRFLKLKKVLLKCIQSNPDLATQAFRKFNEAANFKELVITTFSVEELFNYFIKSDVRIGKIVSVILNTIEQSSELNHEVYKIRDQIILSAYSLMLESKWLSNADFIKKLLEEIIMLNVSVTIADKIFNALVKCSDLKGFDLQLNELKLSKGLPENKRNFNLPYLLDLAKNKQDRKKVLEIVKQNYNHFDFIKYRIESSDEDCPVLNCIVAKGSLLRADYVNHYALIIDNSDKNNSHENLRNALNELFWNCVVKTNSYYGQASFLESSFLAQIKGIFPSVSVLEKVSKTIVSSSKSKGSLQDMPKEELIVIFEKCFIRGKRKFNLNGRDFSFKELFETVLERFPYQLYKILRKAILPGGTIELMKKQVSFSQFCVWISSGTPAHISKAIRDINSLSTLMLSACQIGGQKDLSNLYWAEALQLIKTNHVASGELRKLVKKSLTQLSKQNVFTLDWLVDEIKRNSNILSKELVVAITETISTDNIGARAELLSSVKNEDYLIEEVEKSGQLYEFCLYIINTGELPDWGKCISNCPSSDYLLEIVNHHPIKLFLVLKNEFISDERLNWLHYKIGFEGFISSISNFNREQAGALSILSQFYSSLDRLAVHSRDRFNIQAILFRKLITAWTTNNWRLISVSNIWNELYKEMSFTSVTSKEEFITVFKKSETLLPAAMRISFRKLVADPVVAELKPEPGVLLLKKPIINKSKSKEADGDIVLVRNAGLVLINNYITTLFDRAGITKNRGFISIQKQMDAVHYLQYVVTGLSETEEAVLPLNKVLCGIPISQPIPDGVEISEEHKKMIKGLIKAMISHWPDIGETSINGFRGNWLVRDGKLSEKHDRWELIVEKRAYDILINKSPFSFSIIKHPWMDKPLHVTWTY